MGKQVDFSLGLHQERLFGFDDFDGNFSLGLNVLGAYNLTKRSFSDPLPNFISSIEQLSLGNDIIVVLVIPTVVGRTLHFTLLLGPRRPPGVSLLVIDSIDVLIRINQ